MNQEEDCSYMSQDLFADEDNAINGGQDNVVELYSDFGMSQALNSSNGTGLLPGTSNGGSVVNNFFGLNGIAITDSDLEHGSGILPNLTDSDGSLRKLLETTTMEFNEQDDGPITATASTASHFLNDVKINTVGLNTFVTIDSDGFYGRRIEIPDEEVITLDNWTGPFNFKVTPFLETEKGSKTKSIFSKEMNKLFCSTHTAVPFKFEMDYDEMGNLEHYIVRAFLVYEDNDAVNKPVLRCTHHLQEEETLDKEHPDRAPHMVRPSNPKSDVVYFQNPVSNRCYLLMPMKLPEPGQDFVTRRVCFTCRNSCHIAGLDIKSRRSMSLAFYLFSFHNGTVVGRSHSRVRVCSAPQRDFNKEVNPPCSSANRKRKSEEVSNALPAPKLVRPGAAEVPLSSTQVGEAGTLVPFTSRVPHMEPTLRSIVVGKPEDDGVSSSQETVYSFAESEYRIQLKTHIKDVRWALKLKHSPNPVLKAYSTNVFNALKLTQDLCNSARRIDEEEKRAKEQEKSPDGGFHDIPQD